MKAEATDMQKLLIVFGIFLWAHDSVHKYGGNAISLDLPR
jgi:hypothetical protein